MLNRAERVRGIGLALREAVGPGRLREIGQALDAWEGTSLWLPEFSLRESFGQLGYVAGHTRRVRLATGVAPMAARTPVACALAAATIEDLSDGRAILGLGVSHPGMTGGWHGLRPGSNLRWAQEYVTVVRQVLDGHTSDFNGIEVRSDGFELLGGARPDVPIVLAALGPKMLELGGQVADGVLLNWTTPSYAAESSTAVLRAAEPGPGAPAIGAYLRIAAGPDAVGQARKHADFYIQLAAYRESLLRMGFQDSADLAGEAARELILVGDAEEIADRAGAWIDSGVDPIIIYPIGDETAIDLALAVVDVLSARRAGSVLAEPPPGGRRVP
jgi:alkanesulfonate monooxygenase SsuD/methylene tetrahydromethanopterin reductase-like flavin-dependent oxidoreductase (luciferase family)